MPVIAITIPAASAAAITLSSALEPPGWITAVVRDAMMVKWLWLIFDLVLAPLGALRGFMMWFGWA